MRHIAGWLVALALAAGTAGAAEPVEIDGMKSTPPAEWKAGKPTEAQMRMGRYAQYTLPKAEGDGYDAELLIFHFPGGAGSTKQNLERWKGMFVPPEGKTANDVSKVEETTVNGVKATILDLTGSYVYKSRPFDPSDKGEKRPDYRMIAVVWESPKGPYYFRFVGPAKTVEKHKKGFDEWMKAFK